MPKHRAENPAERLQVEEPEARREGCPALLVPPVPSGFPIHDPNFEGKAENAQDKTKQKDGCCAPRAVPSSAPASSSSRSREIWHPHKNPGSLRVPSCLTQQVREPRASALHLPLAWARTCLITASFNYCPSFPKGFQPISVFTSHPHQFIASLPCVVVAAEAPRHLQAAAERTENSHKSERSWTSLNWKFVCAVCSPPWMNTALMGNIKPSIHHKFVVDHVLETNAAAQSLPFSARILLSPYTRGQLV